MRIWMVSENEQLSAVLWKVSVYVVIILCDKSAQASGRFLVPEYGPWFLARILVEGRLHLWRIPLLDRASLLLGILFRSLGQDDTWESQSQTKLGGMLLQASCQVSSVKTIVYNINRVCESCVFFSSVWLKVVGQGVDAHNYTLISLCKVEH